MEGEKRIGVKKHGKEILQWEYTPLEKLKTQIALRHRRACSLSLVGYGSSSSSFSSSSSSSSSSPSLDFSLSSKSSSFEG